MAVGPISTKFGMEIQICDSWEKAQGTIVAKHAGEPIARVSNFI